MRRAAFATFAVVVILAVAACEPTVTKHVLVVGDSITQKSADNINLAANKSGALFTTDGAGLSGLCDKTNPNNYWQTRVASILEHFTPDQVVVELGTNDVDPECLSTYADRIDSLMTVIGDLPVFWINAGDHAQAFETINAALTDATTRWTNLTILDFQAHFTGHPEWYPDDERHPSDAGQDELGRWLVESLPLPTP